ncbi:tetratricopeptide repeat-containing sensor histidine kinase [Aquimarina algiphila]|uniref:histidine kinase n=1 Tax=Aquimarina algiphila TaxID=2047982 RepID=A0A554VK09_9FLAO|nr:tetratricopeptide repeat protein [Aquimarina algiphila]TSE08257.1 tetratricopeptide repeat protein [Aquimarina algiphila]
MKKIIHFLRQYGCLFLLFFYVSLTAQTDSLEQKLAVASKKEKIELYKQLTNKYSKISVDRAIDYAKQGLELVKNENNKNTGFFYIRLGKFYNDKSDHENALLYYTKALEVSKKLKYELGIGKCYQNIGVVHIRMGEYETALDYYLKALKIYEKSKEENLIVAITNNLGTLYSCRLKDDDNATIYYEKALELSHESGNQEYRAYVLGNVSEMYMRQKRFDKAKKTLTEAFKIAEETNYLDLMIGSLNNLSQISIDEEKYEEALIHSKRALQMRLDSGYSEDNTLAYLTLANIYEKLGDLRTAGLHYDKALSVGEKIGALPQLSRVYGALHEYANRKREHQKSYEYLLKYNEIKDSLFTKEKDKQLKEVQAKFDLENKEKEVLLLTNENQIKELENKNQRTTQIILITGLVALTIIVLTLFYAYKNKQKTNKILAKKNKQISETLKDREILLKEVHHRVKNNLQIVSSLLRLQHKFGDHKSSFEILQEIQDKIQAMAIIHERLYKSSDLSLINLQTYLDNLLTYFNTSYDLPEQNITITTAIDNINLDMDYLVPCGLIVNEIIANSIKYAFQEDTSGRINIEASKNHDTCMLKIQDTGVGFPKDFKIEDSKSLGMQLIQGLTKQINGTVEIFSNPGACYTITFDIKE